MSTVQSLLEQEYMTLAPGVGIVPEKFRNRGYEKLGYEPGEGGIRLAEPKDTQGTGQMQQFLAAIAAGADPQEFAKNVLAGDQTKPTSRGRRGSQEA